VREGASDARGYEPGHPKFRGQPSLLEDAPRQPTVTRSPRTRVRRASP
jgi:hypothetical protein